MHQSVQISENISLSTQVWKLSNQISNCGKTFNHNVIFDILMQLILRSQ